jgi:hypothetical protein
VMADQPAGFVYIEEVSEMTSQPAVEEEGW